MPKGIPCSFGRSVEIRTPGLQYPKLARYQLRYTSLIFFIEHVREGSKIIRIRTQVMPRKNDNIWV